MTCRMIERLLAAALVLSALFFVATRARAEEAAGQYWAAEYARHTKTADADRSKGGARPRAPAASGSLPVVAADLVAEAKRFLGSRNFTGFAGPWCKAGLNIWLRASGYYADKSLRAIDALHDGRRLNKPAVGAIAVMRHHVAIVTDIVLGGVRTISANHGHRVGEGFYPLGKIIAFVQPTPAKESRS